MQVNEAGRVVQTVWQDLPNHYARVALDAFVVMPNHVHGVIVLGECVRPETRRGAIGARRQGLTEVVRGFKTFSARRINELYGTSGSAVWQRSFYDHVVRGEAALNKIRRYIAENPARWPEDEENPAHGVSV